MSKATIKNGLDELKTKLIPHKPKTLIVKVVDNSTGLVVDRIEVNC